MRWWVYFRQMMILCFVQSEPIKELSNQRPAWNVIDYVIPTFKNPQTDTFGENDWFKINSSERKERKKPPTPFSTTSTTRQTNHGCDIVTICLTPSQSPPVSRCSQSLGRLFDVVIQRFDDLI